MSKVLGARRLLVLLSVLMAASFVASAAVAASGSPWDVPAAPIPEMSSWAQDPVWQQARVQAEVVAAAQRAAVSSPSVDAQRARSATAFDDLSRPEAQELAQQTFPDLMAAPVDALGLPAGAHVTSYVSATEARVEDAHGKRLLLESTAPFATKDEDSGQLSKVDLSLSDEGGALVPDNPVVDVTLPDSATDSLTLPDSGLGVSLAGGVDVAGRVEDDRVFYGEVSTDTDYITVAQRQGAQVMWQLRSPQATESPSLDLDLPAGEHARLTSALTGASSDENPSVQIVTDDNTVIDTIAAPSAVDADGVSVPARYRLDGSRLSVDVPHREQQITYPVLVDPAINEVWGGTDWYNSGAGQSGGSVGQWGFTATEGGLGNPWFLQNNNSPTGYGMAIESWPGAFLYTAGAGAYYHWDAPPYTNIAGVWFDGLYHRSEGDHLFAGIISSHGWETVYNIQGDTDYQQSSQTPNPAWELSSVVFGVFEDMTTTHPVPGWVAVRGVSILVGDTRPPDDVHLNWAHFDGHDFGYIPPGPEGFPVVPWVNSATNITYQVAAHDLGLGLQHVGVMDAANNWAGNAWHSGCTGNRTSPCPANVVWNQTITPKRGYNDLRPVAIDIAGNVQFGPMARIRIDGDDPYVEISGDLPSHSTDGTLGYEPTLNIYAEDDAMSTLGGQYHQSGVKKVDVYYTDPSGAVHHPMVLSAPGGCTDDCDVAFPNVKLPITAPGHYGLNVVATDNTNHTRSRTLAFDVRNDTSWIYGGEDHTIDTDGEAATVGQLLAGDGWQTIWNGLLTADKNGMMAEDDPYFSSWVSKVDHTSPGQANTVVVDSADPSTRTASFSWSPGDDPDLAAGVQGSGPDELHGEYRYRRAGGSFTSWIASESMSGTLPSVDAGDVLDVDVRQYDAAGNASDYVRTSLTVPAVSAHAAFAWAAPLVCVAGGCEAAAPVLIGVGAVAGGVFLADNVHWSVKREGSESDIPVADSAPTFGLVNGETLADWQQRGKRQRGSLRAKLKDDHELEKGQQAHHIVPVADRRADYARDVLYKCGIDLNDLDNGVGLSPKDHYQTFSRAYFNNLDKILGRHDPDKSISPCDEFRDDPVHGLRATLRAIAKALREGKFFN